MNCLVVAATHREITPLLAWLPTAAKASVQPDILVTGIGLTATSYHLGQQLQIRHYDLVLQAGVAGCFNKNMALGTVVAVKAEAIADQGVMETVTWKTIFDMQLQAPSQFPYTRGWLLNPHKALLQKTGLKAVKAVSVNQITSKKKMLAIYNDAFKPVAESMEGAALHYTCLMKGIPFLQLRAMSNYVGERNKKHWEMQAAITSLNKVLIQLLQQL
ncbi:MAG TPA: futalosine hydrolase [Chitinophagaceae bacterium]|nr:futalosine hydrolase [Chitinophagaceae bacterium]